jgi:hypothetical protein
LGSGGQLEVGLLEGADRQADLADVFAAAVAAGQVLVEGGLAVGWQRALEVARVQASTGD